MNATTKQLLLVLLLTLAVAGAVGWLELLLQQKAGELRTVLQTISNEAEVEREFSALSDLLDQTAEDRETIAALAIQGQDGSIAFLNEVEALAAAHAIELTGARLDTITSSDIKADFLTLTYNVAGPSDQMNVFIKLLETLPYASYIDNLSLTEERATDGRPAQASGSVTVYALLNQTAS